MKIKNCNTVQTSKVVTYAETTFIVPTNVNYMAISIYKQLHGFARKPIFTDNNWLSSHPDTDVLIATDVEIDCKSVNSLQPA